nr:hypothetical protein B11C_110091 [Bartonella sp. 1-1C]
MNSKQHNKTNSLKKTLVKYSIFKQSFFLDKLRTSEGAMKSRLEMILISKLTKNDKKRFPDIVNCLNIPFT